MLSTMKMAKVAVMVAAGARLTSALSLSSTCQSTLAQLVTSTETTCLNAQSLVGLVVSTSDASVISTINSWLTGMCSQTACSNQTLSDVVSNVTSGCSSDLQSAGISTSDPSELVSIVQQYYPTVREAACLADTSDNKTLCATELLTNIQSQVGTITKSNVQSVVSEIAEGSITLGSNVTCTDCTKAMYGLAAQADPSLASTYNSTVADQCGASFTNGTEPSTITQTANDAASSSTSSGAFSVSPAPFAAVAISSLVAVSSVFALLA
ncbi:hypothetical protein DAEQUDRAFT_406105 [Daedalea quercina L-15889]|uniref:Uncharacterized protein n=1 Tax=Daedalea quercina L-15889 TaxID=1314783 RepID=A0A165NN57_9APHY|nr:hypothetical protein DAEQUDRAFT_406105 [Daedalea quercina L-15889]